MFDWKNSTLEDCAWHVARVSPQHTTSALAYYKRRSDEEVLTKIQEARKLAKRYRVLIKAERLTEEILKEGLESASNTTSAYKGMDQ